MEKNKVKINICGENYAISTDESAEYALRLGEEINTRIKEIRMSNPFVSVGQAAVLVALEYADACKKTEGSAENLRAQMKDYLEDSSTAKTERDFYKRELDRLKTELKAKNDQITLFSDEKK